MGNDEGRQKDEETTVQDQVPVLDTDVPRTYRYVRTMETGSNNAAVPSETHLQLAKPRATKLELVPPIQYTLLFTDIENSELLDIIL